MKEYEVIKGYRDDPALRGSFNALAGKTFGLDFEGWYRNGYWTDKYNPYSILIDGEIAANVSVNRTDFLWNNQRKHLIQLGTVMTEEKYRGQGWIYIPDLDFAEKKRCCIPKGLRLTEKKAGIAW